MILTGETELLGGKHYTGSVVDGWVSREHWWNDTERGITEVLGQKHFPVSCVPCTSQMF
jgi:hypothetical protein